MIIDFICIILYVTAFIVTMPAAKLQPKIRQCVIWITGSLTNITDLIWVLISNRQM